MSDPRDKKSICADYSSELSAKEETDAMIAELREAGGSDLDSVIEASEATDGTAIGWTIVQVNSDGSILCRDPRGTRRRFWFEDLRSQCSQKEAGRMNEEESRAVFEKWYFERNVCLPRIYTGSHPLTGHYIRLEARAAWAAWQAAIKWVGEK